MKYGQFFFNLCILNNFLEDLYVFRATINTLEKGLLVASIDISIVHHEVVEPHCFDLVVRLAEDSGESQGAVIGWVF